MDGMLTQTAEMIFPIIKKAFDTNRVEIFTDVRTFLNNLGRLAGYCEKNEEKLNGSVLGRSVLGRSVFCNPYSNDALNELKEFNLKYQGGEEFPDIYANLIKQYSTVAFSGEVPEQFYEIKEFVEGKNTTGGYKSKKRKSTKRKSTKRKSTKRRSTRKKSKKRKYKKTRRRH